MLPITPHASRDAASPGSSQREVPVRQVPREHRVGAPLGPHLNPRGDPAVLIAVTTAGDDDGHDHEGSVDDLLAGLRATSTCGNVETEPRDPVSGAGARTSGRHACVTAVWDGGPVAVSLSEGSWKIVGRGADCDLVIPIPSISRRHARLDMKGGVVSITDLGSTNGTFVRGLRLAPCKPERLGHRVSAEVGDAVLLVGGSDLPGAVAPPRGSHERDDPPGFVRAEDGPMVKLQGLIERFAPTKTRILISGEPGTGKEVMAQWIHRLSKRKGPLVCFNCAELGETLIERELFGHEKGAFTGADRSSKGLFEAAHDGTLFMDEIGEFPLALQSKVLRMLESGEVRRLGGTTAYKADVRILSATNRDLEGEIEAGRFREDLYERLNGMPIALPPLRERPGEILPLAWHFLRQACMEEGLLVPELTEAAEDALVAHWWPSNARELRNVMRRAALLCDGEPIQPEHLQLTKRRSPSLVVSGKEVVPAPRTSLTPPAEAGRERERILEALVRTGYNQKEAAELLGISRHTLMRRVKSLGIVRPRRK